MNPQATQYMILDRDGWCCGTTWADNVERTPNGFIFLLNGEYVATAWWAYALAAAGSEVIWHSARKATT